MNSPPIPPSPLTPQQVKDFLHRLRTESKNVIALFADSRVLCSVSGTAREVEGFLVVSPKHDAEIAESSGIRVAIAQLLALPCEFTDPREFKGSPFASFFETEVRFDFGLCFVFPQGGLFCLTEMKA